MANRELRALRNEAHRNFDRLHKQGLMSKEDAYCWLASILAAPLGQAHIGCLGEYYCRRVIEESEKVLNLQKKRTQRKEAGVGYFSGKCSAPDDLAVNRDM
jgi:thermostable 8-oxoguanine DNA glycosylase